MPVNPPAAPAPRERAFGGAVLTVLIGVLDFPILLGDILVLAHFVAVCRDFT